MIKYNTVRVLFLNFITSVIIAIVTVNILDAFDLNAGVYLGILFGLYFLAVYCVNNLVEAREIPNSYLRFLAALIYIVLFDIVFIYVMPMLFGADVFPPTETLLINSGGVNMALKLSVEFYMVLFAIVVMILNFIIYRRTKHYIN
ncbi:hypothetical protein [Methanobrevibacter sp.]|uniref:hypothetical protein n=1 Tax=Methanobrevibacter sp. TaxID=66852 RepID=UPI00388F7EA0